MFGFKLSHYVLVFLLGVQIVLAEESDEVVTVAVTSQNDGSYVHDDRGQYVHDDSGVYVADNSGSYHYDGVEGRWLPDEKGVYHDDLKWRYVPDTLGVYQGDNTGNYQAHDEGKYVVDENVGQHVPQKVPHK